MSADFKQVYVGYLDCTKLGQQVVLDVSQYTTGMFQAVPRSGASYAAWVCTIKRSGGGTPSDFSSALSFTTSALTQPTTDGQDLSSTGTVVFATSTVGSSGLIDIYACVKADT